MGTQLFMLLYCRDLHFWQLHVCLYFTLLWYIYIDIYFSVKNIKQKIQIA